MKSWPLGIEAKSNHSKYLQVIHDHFDHFHDYAWTCGTMCHLPTCATKNQSLTAGGAGRFAMFCRGPKLGATVDRSVRAVDAMDKEFPIDEHRATKQLGSERLMAVDCLS